MASKWPVVGEARRRLDYQIWCGPAMGAFNDWVRGSFLQAQANRGVVQIALNLLEGAASAHARPALRSVGVGMPAAAFSFAPRFAGMSFAFHGTHAHGPQRRRHDLAAGTGQAGWRKRHHLVARRVPSCRAWDSTGWGRWFEDAAALVMACTVDEGVAIFFQSDIQHGGFWIDKGSAGQSCAERSGMSCLFHKIVCRKPPGTSSFGRASYAHMLGFGRRASARAEAGAHRRVA